MSHNYTTRLLYNENYQLACYEVEGFGKIPVVDGWIQFSLSAHYIPNLAEQEQALKAFAALANQAKKNNLIYYWHFLRKAPGIKLRFQIVSIEALAWLANEVSNQSWQWLAQIEADSIFAQRELLNAHYPQSYAVILDLAATQITQTIPAKNPYDLAQWVELVCYFIQAYVPDTWLAWEALGRFEQMRSQAIKHTNNLQSYYSVESFLIHLKIIDLAKLVQQDKALLTGTLMLLNYVFNIWGIDAITQDAILAQARNRLRPIIAGKDVL